MSIFTDLRSVSENAIDQLAGRFKDLPRPLLAAIGAGDLAVEQLAKLREQFVDKVGNGRDTNDEPEADDTAESSTASDFKAFAADLPHRAQKIVGDVARHVEEFAKAAPEKAQRLIGELPGKVAEFGDSLSPENLRSTLEAYTQFVGSIYDTLADRGGETVAKGHSDEAAADATAGTSEEGAAEPSAAAGSAAEPAAEEPAAKKPAAKKPAARKAPATKPAAPKPPAKKPAAPKPAAPKRSTGQGATDATSAKPLED